MKLNTLVLAAAALFAAPAFAHDDATLDAMAAPHGGQLRMSGAYHLELVLAKDARQVPDTPCPWHDGLYVNSGHGSRGLITAPLCGELLAAWLNDEPLPLPRAVAEACHPNRFLLRKLIRGQ